MKNTLLVVAGSAVVALGLAGCSGAEPDAVVRQYLEAGSRGDMEAARKHVLERCLGKGEGSVGAIRMMGVPITIKKLDMSVVSKTNDRATVHFEVSGSAKGSGETEILGAKVKMEGVNVENAAKNGELQLERVDGQWKIACD